MTKCWKSNEYADLLFVEKGNLDIIPLTKEIILKINPQLDDFQELKKELDEIGYKYENLTKSVIPPLNGACPNSDTPRSSSYSFLKKYRI